MNEKEEMNEIIEEFDKWVENRGWSKVYIEETEQWLEYAYYRGVNRKLIKEKFNER